jgi:peptide/nickel transport system substrate-binding protein
MDPATYQETVLARSEPFYVGFGWWGWRPDPDQYLSTLMYSESNNNYGYINDPRIDDLLSSARAATTVDERVDLYHSLRDIVSEDSIYIYYWEGPNIKGLSPAVRDFVHRPDTIIRYHHLWLES